MDPKPVTVDKSRIPLPSAEPTPAPVPAPAEAPPADPGTVLPPEQVQAIEEQVVTVLRSCYDPEIPVNIYELGLIYGVEVAPSGGVHVRMTLTSPMCPVAGSLPPEVQAKVQDIPGVTAAKVEVVWDPPWDKDMMSEAARLQLGLFD